MLEFVEHTLKPIYNKESKILILGTMPSPKSREYKFYYSHPQNRFWKVISCVLNQDEPKTNEEKETFLLKNGIAMWDVLKSCEINGADDSSIKSPVVNDISLVVESSNVRKIFTTGKKATDLYKRYCEKNVNMPSVYLPSTSAANCRNYNYDSLVKAYEVLVKYL